MKHLSLAARYRPQTFAEVVGQDMVKAVLSRAAAEDRPAVAYLLSGTRGVGKTTMARIFAKALNCAHAPGPEPCNQCDQCRKITQGIHVDVAEIDAASNTGVDDVRALRENIGYATMEGRYKIFIIDEAHMLSKQAFNALLKTLEEPPDRVVFIFATTEVHKFLPTIVSRCQSFVFRHLSEDALAAHLTDVLHKENVSFEDAAVRIIARRAAGSVRDSMSLLDQTLAMGGDTLTVETTRQVLGLAGQEVFTALFDAVQRQNCAAVAELCHSILQQGLDIGFFLRELASALRQCFLLRQGGAAMTAVLGMPADEMALWQQIASRFPPAQLHASWQMVLDAQRDIIQNPEPSSALELLLLNLALLPRLLPIGEATPYPAAVASSTPPAPSSPQATAPPEAPDPPATTLPPPSPAVRQAGPASAHHQPPSPRRSSAAKPGRLGDQHSDAPSEPVSVEAVDPSASPESVASVVQDWGAFCDFCATWQGNATTDSTPGADAAAGHVLPPVRLLRGIPVQWQASGIRLQPGTEMLAQQLQGCRENLLAALVAYGVPQPMLHIVPPRPYRAEKELIADFSQRPELGPCLEILRARVTACHPEKAGNTPS